MNNNTMYFQRDMEIQPQGFYHTEPILTAFTIKEVDIKIILTRVYNYNLI